MNKKELVDAIAEKTGMNKKESRKLLNVIIGIVIEEMKKDGKLLLMGFGTFFVKRKSARKGVNPSTFVPIEIPAKRVVSFKPSAYLNSLLKRKKGRKRIVRN